MKSFFKVAIFTFSAFALNSLVQAQSSTDIFLVAIKDGQVYVDQEGPVNLTRREGYDNQPSFSPDGTGLLYTSQRGNQTDIYRFDVASGVINQITRTPESEYSPTFIPGRNAFAVIRVETDGTQRLWQFKADGSKPSLLLRDVKPVGYQAWLDDQRVAMFILGDPATLQLSNLNTGQAATIAKSIGRSIHRIPDTQHISFVDKQDDEKWTIRRIDPDNRKPAVITATLKGQEDYTWMADGSILMADGAKIFRWTAKSDWSLLHDFSAHNIKTITRMAVSPDGSLLAFVAEQ